MVFLVRRHQFPFTIQINVTIHFTFSGGVVRVSGTNYVPRINMEAKSLDWTIKMVSFKDQLLKLEFQLQEQVESLIFRAYWGVDIGAYHQVLRSPWPWFVSAFENGNATFGSENCQVFDTVREMSSLENGTKLTADFQCPSDLDLGPTPRTKYPLVLVSTVKTSSEESYPMFNFHVIHISDTMHFNTHILAHYLKWPSAKVNHLVPIYTEENCVVCIESKATRVTLPCR